MAYKHSITTPANNDLNVLVVQRGTKYYIDADGIPDDDSDGLVILEVYGKVFATVGDIPKTQDKILQMIGEGAAKGCIRGTPGGAGDLHYTFRDSAHNSIPVVKLDTPNYLQVWAKFKGDRGDDPILHPNNNFYRAAHLLTVDPPPPFDPVKFTPKLPSE
jgi:hypothetical protein